MKMTSKSEYALLSLLFLARQDNDAFVTVAHIAAQQNIPPKFLEQILLVLKRGGFVRSSKGQGGGYRIAKPPTQISLAEIIRFFDGALAPTESVSKYFYEPTPIEKEQKLTNVFRDIRDFISNKLEQTTLADVL